MAHSSTDPDRLPPKIPAAPELLTADLRRWAGERVAAAGRRDALLGRVELLYLTHAGRALDGRVRGNRTLPYQVQVRLGVDGPECRCTCARSPCRHAVAVLEALRFPLSETPKRTARRRGTETARVPSTSGFVVLARPSGR